MRHPTGELADRLHFLGLPERFLGLATLRQLDGLGDDRRELSRLVAHRPHLEIEPPPAADRKIELNLPARDLAMDDDVDE